MTPVGESPWRLSWRADPVTCAIADRHYNRQKPGAAQFVPPGRCLVLRTADGTAAWVASWPFPQFDSLCNLGEVADHRLKDDCGVGDMAKNHVAPRAEQAPHPAGDVIVINAKRGQPASGYACFRLAADGARHSLRLKHHLVLGNRHPVPAQRASRSVLGVLGEREFLAGVKRDAVPALLAQPGPAGRVPSEAGEWLPYAAPHALLLSAECRPFLIASPRKTRALLLCVPMALHLPAFDAGRLQPVPSIRGGVKTRYGNAGFACRAVLPAVLDHNLSLQRNPHARMGAT
jgi:hypothetical protein